ncbi:MAG: 3-keto-disaccharide hydrolase [Woeseiaceae bacterium]
MKPGYLAAGVILLLSLACQAQSDAVDWIELFNGKDIDDWIVKIRGYPAGENFSDTFRVENGLMSVGYEGYGDYEERFGHIFYKHPFSHYKLLVEYRFTGEQAANAPGWATRNSGVMIHAQDPATMPDDQDFPISLEVQFLGGLGDGKSRPTANVCSPGTNIEYQGQLNTTHCIESSSPTFDGDQWVTVEALVLGSGRIVHYVNGETVIEYANTTYGGGVVSGHRKEMKPDGEPIRSGYIALQSESHPVQFRRVAFLNLKGCMHPEATNYKSYYVEPDPDSCDF